MFTSASATPSTWSASTPTDTNFNNFVNNYGANCGTGNPLFPTPGLSQSSPDIYQQYGFCGNVTSDPSRASSIYHAGSINFTHRAGHGFTFNTNYTYSHNISNADNEFHTSALNPRRAQDSAQLNQDRANSDLDVTHKFALSMVYAFPKTSLESRFARALLNGYSLGSSVLAQSGQPVTLQTGAIDANGNIDTAGDRAFLNPNGVGNTGSDVYAVCELPGNVTGFSNGGPNAFNIPTGIGSGGGCFDPSDPTGATLFPAIGYTPVDPTAKYLVTGFGAQTNLGRNSFRSPGFWTLNLAMYKDVHITETKSLQLGAQAFNLFNHPNYALSNGNVFNTAGSNTALATQGYALPQDPTFLQPKQFGGGIRSMILSLKFIF
jgi:hypothetical protein